jgi:DNA-3-methyladenine glycosylase
VRLERDFYARSVHDVARDLIGCVIRHGATAGRIVETESYHMDEPACHAHVGVTERTNTLFGPPGNAYVYFSYGIHSLLNAVCEEEGVGAAVLIRALEPVDGLELMRGRRGLDRAEDLCSGPGKLTQALAIGLSLNGTSLGDGPIELLTREPGAPEPRIVVGERIGITKATDLPWRFCDADSRHVSRPWPAQMRGRRVAA